VNKHWIFTLNVKFHHKAKIKHTQPCTFPLFLFKLPKPNKYTKFRTTKNTLYLLLKPIIFTLELCLSPSLCSKNTKPHFSLKMALLCRHRSVDWRRKVLWISQITFSVGTVVHEFGRVSHGATLGALAGCNGSRTRVVAAGRTV